MTPTDLVNFVLRGDLPRALEIFLPELLLCLTVILLLIGRIAGTDRRIAPSWIALIGSLLAFTAGFAQFMFLKTGPMDGGLLGALYDVSLLSVEGVGTAGGYFTNLLDHTFFTLFFRLGLLLFLVLMIALTVLSGIPDHEDGPDFYTLLVGSTIGMMITVGANHLLMVFVGIEMMSVPSYAMVGFLKGRRQSSEAALKYIVYGAGVAGVMLYGISLLAGLTGTAELPLVAERLVYVTGGELTLDNAAMLAATMGIVFVLVGLAFKLSLVPFHFWCPDAFEGASAEVAAFLSVASKAAAFALLVRFVLAFTGYPELSGLTNFLGLGLGVAAAVSMTFGNLAAYGQNNVKRILAYSTIAHAGYMLMAVSALLVILSATGEGGWSGGRRLSEASQALEGLMYYLAVYLFMNLVAFAVVALIRNQIFSEEVDDYAGFAQYNSTAAILCVCMAIALFSLVGLPPFGGFFAKLLIFASVFKAGELHWFMYALLVIAGLNTVFSLFYYVRILKAMFIAPQPEHARRVRMPAVVGAYVVLCTLPIIALGASGLQEDLASTARYIASTLFR